MQTSAAVNGNAAHSNSFCPFFLPFICSGFGTACSQGAHFSSASRNEILLVDITRLTQNLRSGSGLCNLSALVPFFPMLILAGPDIKVNEQIEETFLT